MKWIVQCSIFYLFLSALKLVLKICWYFEKSFKIEKFWMKKKNIGKFSHVSEWVFCLEIKLVKPLKTFRALGQWLIHCKEKNQEKTLKTFTKNDIINHSKWLALFKANYSFPTYIDSLADNNLMQTLMENRMLEINQERKVTISNHVDQKH